jgi:hypothetical protein
MSQDVSPGIAKELTSPPENVHSASVPRTEVLGYSQPSLRDLDWLPSHPARAGLLSSIAAALSF